MNLIAHPPYHYQQPPISHSGYPSQPYYRYPQPQQKLQQPIVITTSHPNTYQQQNNSNNVKLPSIQELMPDYFTQPYSTPQPQQGPMISPPLSNPSSTPSPSSPTGYQLPSPPKQHSFLPPPPPVQNEPSHHHHHHQYHHHGVVRSHPYSATVATGNGSVTKKRRGNLPRPVTDILRNWLDEHIHHPYPTESEKNQLMRQTGLTLNQISNWFINARRRRLPQMHRQRLRK